MKTKSKPPFDVPTFLAKVNGGGPYRLSEGSNGLHAGRSCGFRFLHSERQGQGPSSPSRGRKPWSQFMGTGDFFGEGCLAGQPLRLATVSAMTECVIVRMTKADITRVIHEEPAFAELFIVAPLGSQQSCRGGPGRSTVQFERETSGADCFCCWRILARRVGRSRSSRKSARRRWRR